MIERKKANVFLVVQKCDKCNCGYMKYTGTTLKGSKKNIFEHICNFEDCKNTTGYDMIYPYPEYEYVEEKEDE